MTKQKRGLWLFLFSLIPGAGELYMGFRKQGISIMLLFWSIILIGAWGIPGSLFLLPVIWFYSFFNVHNLKSLSEEDFYAVEDHYILLSGDIDFGGISDRLKGKYRTLIAVALIFVGATILWNNFIDVLRYLLPWGIFNVVFSISHQLPQVVIAIAIIFAGAYLLSDKKKSLSDNRQPAGTGAAEEHFWEPYRPYQQTAEEPKTAQPVSDAPSQPTEAATPSQESSVSAQEPSQEYPEYPEEV